MKNPSRRTAAINPHPKSTVFFFANGIYGEHVAGGDLHFIEVARAAAQAGYEVAIFGSKVLESRLRSVDFEYRLLLTSRHVFGKSAEQSFSGQLRLLADYVFRTFRSIRQLRAIREKDFVYAIADSWCDTIPLALSRSRRKMLVLHMQAPTLREILLRSRPDVDRFRLAAIHYSISQRLSLLLLRFSRSKHVFYVHPDMRVHLLRIGFKDAEISPISFGLDADVVASVPDGEKIFDVAWIGRVHRQKGVEDLLLVLSRLAKAIPGFRAVLIGKGAEELRREIEQLGLATVVDFSGLVSEQEKIRLLKTSRVFLMPSRHEGSPRTIGEALLCKIPVVAYDVPTYRPVFGDLVRYVPCFDQESLQKETERQINQMRLGKNYVTTANINGFQNVHSWRAVDTTFLSALGKFDRGSEVKPAPDMCGRE